MSPSRLHLVFLLWLCVVVTSTTSFPHQRPEDHGSQISLEPPGSSAPPGTAAKLSPADKPHRFWDGRNVLLFAGLGASRAADYTSTLNMRRRGRQEILLGNSIVDDHGLFAGVEITGIAASIWASYCFHRTGHHRLERWLSLVHISAATAGAVRNYSLETAHPAILLSR